MIADEIMLRVAKERAAQDLKWGEQNHNDYYWLGILGEEYGEVATALIQGATVHTGPPYGGSGEEDIIHSIIQKKDTTDLERELVHVAAVAIAWLEAIQRRKE